MKKTLGYNIRVIEPYQTWQISKYMTELYSSIWLKSLLKLKRHAEPDWNICIPALTGHICPDRSQKPNPIRCGVKSNQFRVERGCQT